MTTSFNKLFFPIILFLLCSSSYAQPLSYRQDPVKFLDDVENTLAVYDKKYAKEFVVNFAPIWNGSYTDDQKSIVYRTANTFLDKKFRAVPELKDYFTCLMHFPKHNKSTQDFKDWHYSLDQMLSGRDKKKATDFVNMLANLFEFNYIYTSSSTTWKISKSNYKFSYDKAPVIDIENVNLICFSKNDSSVVYATSGKLYPATDQWEGEGGRVTWERTGLPKDKTYADLRYYKASLKSAGFSADSVAMYTTYFDKPLLGKLQERVLSKISDDKSTYPQFDSYDKRLIIKNIFPNLDYDGGFSLTGNKLNGKGSADELARIIFYFKDKPFLIANALYFTIDPRGVSSDKASIMFYVEKDSISHPGLELRYTNSDQKLTLIRGEQGLAQSPFYNSYHRMDMKFEALYWKVGDPIMEFAPMFGSTRLTAEFESSNFFSQTLYDQLTAAYGTNPLSGINVYANKIKEYDFDGLKLASHLKMEFRDAELLYFKLTTLGFIRYDSEKKWVYMNDKLQKYTRARTGKQDYDFIQIISEDKSNATLSLLSYDLEIRGIKSVKISEKHFTSIYPKQGQIVVKKGLNMAFDGTINAGRTEYFGTDFTFDYAGFKFNINQCDSMRLRVFPIKGHEDKIPNLGRLYTKIEGVKGQILIDDPKNKSGIDETKNMYPILKCTKETYVFFDEMSIQRGAYKRGVFKFVISPFEMDSLNTFYNKGIAFDGELVSAGIFPTFKETLRLQNDYSLGFVRNTPKEGYALYSEKTKYTNEIRLNRGGLQGSGDVDFLTSHAEAKQITFLPDSLVALSEVYVNKGQKSGPEVPGVMGQNVRVTYIPKDKMLYAQSIRKPLEFFDNEAKLNGRLSLSPNGMTGRGLMTFKTAELLAETFKYKYKAIDSDTASFKLHTIEQEDNSVAFKTDNVNAHVDFEKRVGEFKSNGEESFVDFPDNQYICYMDRFKWFMDNDDIELDAKKEGGITIDTDLDLAGSNFYSVHPNQDSLNFRAPKARFDVKKRTITCREMAYIQVADARIYPDSGIVIIRKKAVMDPLKNASIIANYITKYHQMYEANVKITARKKYHASGYYNYIDENKLPQKVYFANIQPDTSFQTVAAGVIPEKDNFMLSPHFAFKGNLEMYASKKELTFEGETRISHECAGLEKNWMKFRAELDPDDIYIPIADMMMDAQGNTLGTGIILNPDTIQMYSTFLSMKGSPKHIDIFKANGFLRFDKRAQEYQIANREKLSERSLPGNFVSLNTNSCLVTGDGRFDFGMRYGQLKTTPIGEMTNDMVKKEMTIRTTMAITFPFHENALERMAKQIREYPDLPPIELDKAKVFEKGVRDLLGLERGDKVISDLNIHGEIKRFPDALVNSIYLADVTFEWDNEEGAYISKGKIGIGTVLKKEVFRYVDGKVKLTKKRTGDVIEIYLQLDENTFYFFRYTKELMEAVSSNNDFNSAISDLKADKTKFKGSKGEDDFQFMLSTKTKAAAFIRQFE
ncbi:MAG: hypothetical protein ACK4K0_03845 [Flavobacteriales bacterium]